MSAPRPESRPESRPFGQRLLWFVALWAAGGGAVGLMSLLLRFWIGPR